MRRMLPAALFGLFLVLAIGGPAKADTVTTQDVPVGEVIAVPSQAFDATLWHVPDPQAAPAWAPIGPITFPSPITHSGPGVSYAVALAIPAPAPGCTRLVNSYHYSYADAASAYPWGAPLLAGSLTEVANTFSQDPGSASVAGGWTATLTTPTPSTDLAFIYQVVEFIGQGGGTLTLNEFTVNVTDTCPDVAAAPDPSLADTGSETAPALVGAASILFAGFALLIVKRLILAPRRKTT